MRIHLENENKKILTALWDKLLPSLVYGQIEALRKEFNLVHQDILL